jgi:2-polyprenyl-6-methoxyphenol hydroxylase-like FAD-dependent oxidoreductase
MSRFKIIVVGAGLGGLCLAQALRRRDIDVEVFERDRTPWDRPQGYRLHLDPDGISALRQVLTPALFELFGATSMKVLPFTAIVDTALAAQQRIPLGEHGSAPDHSLGATSAHLNVNRATLREILLAGLDEFVHFGKMLSHYETDHTGVTASFEDGTRVRGDLLVGADGIRSMVRRQRVPHAQTQDSGVRAIYGRLPIAEAVRLLPKAVREDTFTVALDSKRLFLGLGPVVFPTRPEVAALRTMPATQLHPQDDYVVCIIGGRKELFGKEDSCLSALNSEDLQKLSLALMEDWPEHARAIPAHGDRESFFFVEMYTSVPCKMPRRTNVTLLGDAIHAMTPTLGRGANIAMRDGALLGRHLEDVARGRRPLAQAISEYETEMTAHAFDVVAKSAAMGMRLVGQNPLPSR